MAVLDTAIRQTKKALRRVSKTIVALTKQLAEGDEDLDEDDPEGASELDPNDPIVKEHRQLQADLRRLQRQREEAAHTLNEDPAKSISDFYHTLMHLHTEFHKREPQDKSDLARARTPTRGNGQRRFSSRRASGWSWRVGIRLGR